MDTTPQRTEAWPYDLPLWRRSHQAISPDGSIVATIDDAVEMSMGNPTGGTLRLSTGLAVDLCNPAFLISDDSRFLAVPRWRRRWCLVRQQLLIVDLVGRQCFLSRRSWWFVQPESFSRGLLRATGEPTSRRPESIEYRFPGALAVEFRPWRARSGAGQSSARSLA